jgi:hypothetical protein
MQTDVRIPSQITNKDRGKSTNAKECVYGKYGVG